MLIINSLRRRTFQEIKKYLKEAEDKVWFSRTHKCNNKKIEQTRLKQITRIQKKYPEIKNMEFDNYEIGYWNGIMGALRWVLKEDKDFLDT